MYVCICNAIRECELRKAAREHAGDADAVYEQLGKRPQCGSCLDEATLILLEARGEVPEVELTPGERALSY